MREVLKQALDALEDRTSLMKWQIARDAVKEAIAELESQERNFCPRCGKRTADPFTIHTCTPPKSPFEIF